MWTDREYDYYWGSNNIDWGVSITRWQEQTWYAGLLISYPYDHVQARIGYPSGTPGRFALRLASSHSTWSENTMQYLRQDLNVFKPIYWYVNYSDFRAETVN